MKVNELLKRRRDELDLSMAEVAQRVGVSEGTVSRWESGQIKDIRRSKLRDLAKALKIEPSLLIEDEIEYPTNAPDLSFLESIPLLGSTACGLPIEANREYERISISERTKGADFALRAEGRSMINCGITDGAIVLCKETSQVDNGAIAAIRVEGATTIKRFYQYGDTVILRPCNPEYQDQEYSGDELETIDVFGLVIGSFNEYD